MNLIKLEEGWKKEVIENRKYIIVSIILFIIANILSNMGSMYVDRIQGAQLSDIILDNIPSINLEYLFTYGYTLVIAAILLYPAFFKVKELHIAVFQFSLLLLIRSFFIILTHIQLPENAILTGLPKLYELMTYSNDLFFSGHVAFTFLGFLLFRKEKNLIKWFFLIMTPLMAITVLCMHVHYSIDVFAAFFIAYGSYKIGEKIINFKEKNGKNPLA